MKYHDDSPGQWRKFQGKFYNPSWRLSESINEGEAYVLATGRMLQQSWTCLRYVRSYKYMYNWWPVTHAMKILFHCITEGSVTCWKIYQAVGTFGLFLWIQFTQKLLWVVGAMKNLILFYIFWTYLRVSSPAPVTCDFALYDTSWSISYGSNIQDSDGKLNLSVMHWCDAVKNRNEVFNLTGILPNLAEVLEFCQTLHRNWHSDGMCTEYKWPLILVIMLWVLEFT